jgi:ankyrin repeat protein
MTMLLIKAGADVNIRSQYDLTPLAYSGKRNQSSEIAALLIENMADINAKSKSGETPLMWVIEEKNTQVAKFLIMNGADVNIVSDDNDYSIQSTPLELAARGEMYDVARLLLERGAVIEESSYDIRWRTNVIARDYGPV